MNITNNLFIQLKTSLSLNDSMYALLSSILYIGLSIGSLISGYLSNYFGRRKCLIFINLIMFVLSLSLIFTLKNYISFTVIRFFLGIFIGMQIPMLFGTLVEFLPILMRSFVMASVWLGFSLGSLYILCLMLLYTPNLETSGLKEIFILCSLPSLILFVLFILLLDESPRFLILICGNEEEGINLIEKIYKKSLTKEEKSLIINEINESNKDVEFSMKSLFQDYFIKTTLLLILIWIIISLMTFGTMFVLQNTLKKLNSLYSKNKNIEIIYDQIISTLISLPSPILGGGISEIKLVGRKYSLSLFFLLSGIILILNVIFLEHFKILYGISLLFIGAAFNILTCYTTEFYPTKIRDNALGFFYFWSRMSGFSAQFLSVWLEGLIFLLVYYSSIALSFVSFGFSMLLPYETHGNEIDTKLEKD